MSFLGSIFGGGSSQQAYKPVEAQQIKLDPNLVAQQQAYADALKQQAAGQGPSVANLQLQQALQQQLGQNAAQAASARGVSPALALRNSMQTGAQEAQQTAQSGALARAQEELNAQQLLGGTLQGMQQQNLSAQGANQQANLQAQGLTSQIGQAQNKAQGDIFGGIAGAVGQGLMMLNKGGQVPHYADGGPVKAGPSSIIGKMLAGPASAATGATAAPTPLTGSAAFGQGLGHLFSKLSIPERPSIPIYGPLQESGKFAQGGKVPVMLSPGEIKIPPGKAKHADTAAQYAAHAAQKGKKVPGKAKVEGDSEVNDTVSDKLAQGSVVVPRSKSKRPQDAAHFVRALLASQKGKVPA